MARRTQADLFQALESASGQEADVFLEELVRGLAVPRALPHAAILLRWAQPHSGAARPDLALALLARWTPVPSASEPEAAVAREAGELCAEILRQADRGDPAALSAPSEAALSGALGVLAAIWPLLRSEAQARVSGALHALLQRNLLAHSSMGAASRLVCLSIAGGDGRADDAGLGALLRWASDSSALRCLPLHSCFGGAVESLAARSSSPVLWVDAVARAGANSDSRLAAALALSGLEQGLSRAPASGARQRALEGARICLETWASEATEREEAEVSIALALGWARLLEAFPSAACAPLRARAVLRALFFEILPDASVDPRAPASAPLTLSSFAPSLVRWACSALLATPDAGLAAEARLLARRAALAWVEAVGARAGAAWVVGAHDPAPAASRAAGQRLFGASVSALAAAWESSERRAAGGALPSDGPALDLAPAAALSLGALAVLQAWRVPGAAYATLVARLAAAAASSPAGARALLAQLPSLQGAARLGDAWRADVVVAAWLQFLLALLGPCVPLAGEEALAERAVPLALRYLAHSHAPLSNACHGFLGAVGSAGRDGPRWGGPQRISSGGLGASRRLVQEPRLVAGVGAAYAAPAVDSLRRHGSGVQEAFATAFLTLVAAQERGSGVAPLMLERALEAAREAGLEREAGGGGSTRGAAPFPSNPAPLAPPEPFAALLDVCCLAPLVVAFEDAPLCLGLLAAACRDWPLGLARRLLGSWRGALGSCGDLVRRPLVLGAFRDALERLAEREEMGRGPV